MCLHQNTRRDRQKRQYTRRKHCDIVDPFNRKGACRTARMIKLEDVVKKLNGFGVYVFSGYDIVVDI